MPTTLGQRGPEAAGNNLSDMPTDYTDDLRLAHVLADDADSLDARRGSRRSTCT